MTTTEILIKIMEEQGKKKADLGRAVGIEEAKATDLIGKRIRQKNISVNILLEMLGAMGYTLAVVPTGTKLGEKEYEVSINE